VKRVAIIVAGGTGKRMKCAQPKQFLLLKGLPVLMQTIKQFSLYDPSMQIIVALPDDQKDYWKELCELHCFNTSHIISGGGKTRFQTVKKSLKLVNDKSIVAIHDGVRPLVSLDTIDRCFKAAILYGNAVPCISISESMRKVNSNESRQVDRKKFRLIQTPQIFHARIVKNAYNQQYKKEFTDDASVVEKGGFKIKLVDGNVENIKITYPSDLKYAESLIV